MKSTEIKIGNSVLNEEGKVKIIGEISDVFGVAYVKFKDEMNIESTMNISSAPLTNENILKIGFEIKKGKYVLRIDRESPFDIVAAPCDREIFSLIVGIGAKNNQFILLNDVQYLHQLENLVQSLS